MTNFSKTIALLGVVALMSGCLTATDQKVPDRPNIILIMADDLGYECLGANGGTSYNTPELDRLAKSGIRFEHCYAQPLCTPTRLKLMTGIYNVRNYVKFGVLDRNQTTFAHILKNAGYATCIAGKWQLGSQPDSPGHFGFDESCLWQHTRGRTDGQEHDTRYPNPRLEINGEPVDYTQGEYAPDVTSDFICDFIERHKKQPFFAYYPMILTHCPFHPTPGSADWDSSDRGSTSYKGDTIYFGGMVSYTDRIVSKLTAKLDELGLTENTLIVFTGDNGTDVPVVSVMDGRKVAGRKGQMTDAGTRVPLIVNWKGVIPEGQVCSDLVDFTDFLPTICETAGITLPEDLNIDGRSFFPQLIGRTGNPRDWIYIWYSRAGKDSDAKVFARNQRYKLYRSGNFYDISSDVLEKAPLQDGDLNDETREVKAMLEQALNQYKDARP
ncbi:MAG: sulfatase-like hydrolase/transferase, partial [Bacteroidales bacterium]|nr:sulfatase-like hydrolase/transferase [Bacteroidales bacterium]